MGLQGNTTGEKFLQEAKIDVYLGRNGLLHKINTNVAYKARKQIIHWPNVAIPKLISLIPGADLFERAFSPVTDFIADKVLEKRKKSKTNQYRELLEKGVSDVEALRKCAKWDAKSLKDLVEKIESNQVKLKHATTLKDLSLGHLEKNIGSDVAIANAFRSLVDEEHYINKILMMQAAAQHAMKNVDNYIIQLYDINRQQQKYTIDLIDSVYDKNTIENSMTGQSPLYEGKNPQWKGSSANKNFPSKTFLR